MNSRSKARAAQVHAFARTRSVWPAGRKKINPEQNRNKCDVHEVKSFLDSLPIDENADLDAELPVLDLREEYFLGKVDETQNIEDLKNMMQVYGVTSKDNFDVINLS
ncbi:unnamed protein product [Ceutorhynchus assimilis]|uniref:Uncharacterized protein n=1 Tax=Ceutorhynchus assimilis TaxID=467358 RepID=A0A9N9QMA2_9CUCU|nr:unnamed protein product [Ceutorhynchus assimilis]